MPIYEYQCQSCDKVFEYMQRMSEDRKTICEECEGPLERIISQSAFHLKGGGWYKDLYSSTKKDGDNTGEGSTPASKEAPTATGGSATGSSATDKAATSSPTPAKPAPTAPAKAKSSGSGD